MAGYPGQGNHATHKGSGNLNGQITIRNQVVVNRHSARNGLDDTFDQLLRILF